MVRSNGDVGEGALLGQKVDHAHHRARPQVLGDAIEHGRQDAGRVAQLDQRAQELVLRAQRLDLEPKTLGQARALSL